MYSRSSPPRATLLLVLMLFIGGGIGAARPVPLAPPASYIVQANSSDVAEAAVVAAGGTVTQRLAIIDGVAAQVDAAALARLRAHAALKLSPDTPVRSAGDVAIARSNKETFASQAVLLPSAAANTYQLHNMQVNTPESFCDATQGAYTTAHRISAPLRGESVTIAVVDTGMIEASVPWMWQRDNKDRSVLFVGSGRQCLIYRDFIEPISPFDSMANSDDPNGHGSHIVSTMVDMRTAYIRQNWNVQLVGVAPRANMVVARALNADGSGSYATVIAAIDWLVSNRTRYNIRVLNLSLYAPVTGPYWDDPLNQAVMKAWQAGITVVVAAGNNGPEAGTITAPGNVPYVITVGAMQSGRYTSSRLDEVASFSSRGPTESAFVKPDIVIPGTQTIASMPKDGVLAGQFPSSEVPLMVGSTSSTILPLADNNAYYQLSGTSMAAAQVSGVAALILQANPGLTNNQVKQRLIATARPAIDATNDKLRYSIWEQGAGLVDAEQAVFTATLASANNGLNIDLDLNGSEHYWGYTTWDAAKGEFRLDSPDGKTSFDVWASGRRASAANSWVWASGRRASAANSPIMTGGRRASAASSLTWAGTTMPWLQPAIQSDEPIQSKTIVFEPPPQPAYTLLPLVMH